MNIPIGRGAGAGSVRIRRMRLLRRLPVQANSFAALMSGLDQLDQLLRCFVVYCIAILQFAARPHVALSLHDDQLFRWGWGLRWGCYDCSSIVPILALV